MQVYVHTSPVLPLHRPLRPTVLAIGVAGSMHCFATQPHVVSKFPLGVQAMFPVPASR